MQQFSNDYTLVRQADEALESAQRLHANECYAAALERIGEARELLQRHLAGDDAVPYDVRLADAMKIIEDLRKQVAHYQDTQRAMNATCVEIVRQSEETNKKYDELRAKWEAADDGVGESKSARTERHGQIDSRYLSRQTDGADPSNPLYGKTVVMSGTFEQIGMERDEVAAAIQQLGAKLNRSVSRTMQVFVMGNRVGPSKMSEVEQLRSEGHDIRIISQIEFKEICSRYVRQQPHT